MKEREKLIDEYIIEEEKKQFKNKIGKVVEVLKEKGGTNGAMNVWEVIKRIKKKRKDPPTAVYDSENQLLEDMERIKERHKEYFIDLLKVKPAENPAEQEQEIFINKYTEEIIKIGEQKPARKVNLCNIKECIKELKKKKCADGEGWKNEYILNGGEKMAECLTKMFNRVLEERTIPSQWKDIIIKTLNKTNVSNRMELKRGIFITNCISKIFERVLKNRNKEKMDEYTSDFQSGGRKNRSAVDNVMLMNAIMCKNRKLGKRTYLLFGDAIKCFDKLWLRSCILELYKAGVDKSDIFFIYNLNNTSQVKIRTQVGETDCFEIGETVKQGSILGPDIACLETDAVNRGGSKQIQSYDSEINIGITVHVDDVSTGGDPEDVVETARKLRWMESQKKFSFGLKKTKWMVVNTGREKVKEIDTSVNKGRIGRTHEYKLLGFWINEKGNCELQIEKNEKKVLGKTSAIKTFVSSNSVGTEYVNVRLKMFSCCLIPSLLYGMEAWHQITKKEYERLERAQGITLRRLLDLPSTTPYEGILIELGIWKVRYMIYYRKIMLYHNITHSEERRTIRKVILAQEREEEEDTFWHDVEKIKKEIKFKGEIKEMKKSEVKKEVKAKIVKKMKEEMKVCCQEKKKLRFLRVEENFQRKKYTEEKGDLVHRALITKLNMQPIYSNFKGDLTKRIMCPLCDVVEDTTEHLVQCTEVTTKNNIDLINIREDQNIEKWRKVLDAIEMNFELRRIKEQ